MRPNCFVNNSSPQICTSQVPSLSTTLMVLQSPVSNSSGIFCSSVVIYAFTYTITRLFSWLPECPRITWEHVITWEQGSLLTCSLLNGSLTTICEWEHSLLSPESEGAGFQNHSRLALACWPLHMWCTEKYWDLVTFHPYMWGLCLSS